MSCNEETENIGTTAIIFFSICNFLQNAHTDLDECALGISGCNQICTNTNGSYVCSCYLGYQIALDNRTCTGKHIAVV